jgi:hypothetical protein
MSTPDDNTPSDRAGGYRVHHDTTDDRSISTAVVSAISELEGGDPLDSGFNLYDNIDPESLDTLVEHARRIDGDLEVTFTIEDYEVSVQDDGDIVVQPLVP